MFREERERRGGEGTAGVCTLYPWYLATPLLGRRDNIISFHAVM
jgi:hypothetical protein